VVRQARSEVTRRRIIDAAVDLFTETGYATTGLSEIIDRVAVTKGALYYHFDSKEALGRAIIADGSAVLVDAFVSISSAPAPAFENMIHGVFAVVELISTDKLARTAVHLCRGPNEFIDAAAQAYTNWLLALSAQAAQAQQQGDLRNDLDPKAVGEIVLAAVLGVEVISSATSSSTDLIRRLTRVWEVLLPAITSEQSLAYFREYLARESMRRLGPSLMLDPAD
jgi:AcrR family transcriptional regulator